MTRDELQNLQDSTAESLLRVREKIEAAIERGDVPSWIMDACSALERASLLYGQTSERIRVRMDVDTTPARVTLH